MCVRLTVPGHQPDPDMIAGIDAMLSCTTHKTKESTADGDWVLDSECVIGGMRHGRQVVDKFEMEPLALSLRKAGYTQLISFIQHSAGGDSTVQPAARLTWQTNGLFFHLNRQWLTRLDSSPRTLHSVILTYGPKPAAVGPFWVASAAVLLFTFALAFGVRNGFKKGETFTAFSASRGVPLIYWAGWLLVSIPFHGLDIAAFGTDGEGMGAQLSALRWYAPAAITLGWILEIILARGRASVIAPAMPLAKLAQIALFRTIATSLAPLVTMLLVSRTFAWNMPFILVSLSLATGLGLLCWHLAISAAGRQRVRVGELHDLLFAIADQVGAPLKRVYIEPEQPWATSTLFSGSEGDFIVPAATVRLSSREELDALGRYGLVLKVRNRYGHRNDRSRSHCRNLRGPVPARRIHAAVGLVSECLARHPEFLDCHTVQPADAH